MPYAIARLKKLKRSNIAGSASHTARERETPNADPTQNNIRFIGSLDPTERLEDLVLAKIAEHEQKRKIRTDGVYWGGRRDTCKMGHVVKFCKEVNKKPRFTWIPAA